MQDVELLSRISKTLKKDIGPAVEGDYPKTQAFMASVVLEKLAGQLSRADSHGAAKQLAKSALAKTLAEIASTTTLNDELSAGISNFATSQDEQALCLLIENLYQSKEALGDERFFQFLTPVRAYMRMAIDQRMEYSK